MTIYSRKCSSFAAIFAQTYTYSVLVCILPMWRFSVFFHQLIYFSSIGILFHRIGIRSIVDGPLVEDTSVADILHCNVSRSFWITWTLDSVKVGQGDVINEPLLAWESTDVHPILGVSVTTGSGKPAHWHFPQEGRSIVPRK